MDGARYTVTLDEFKLFHGIDRDLYIFLIRDLVRDPYECLYIMGLWLWLERAGFYHFVSKIRSLPPFMINMLADEAVACIKCTNAQFPFSSESTEIPVTQNIVEKEISLQLFHDKRPSAFREVESLVRGVCIPSLSDIMVEGRYSNFIKNSSRTCHTSSSSSSSLSNPQSCVENSLIQSRIRANEARNERTMFVTFSKGYPVAENEVRQFFCRLFGNCIESFHMQEVKAYEQSLFAKIVFRNSSFIRSILDGAKTAKFTINGKHVWMRKFVPKTNRLPPCGCPSIGACSCCFF